MTKKRNRPRKKTGSVLQKDMKAAIKEVAKRVPKERTFAKMENAIIQEETQPVKLRSVPIMWGIPMDELMFSKFFANFINLNMMPWDLRSVSEGTYLPHARNAIHNSFIKSSVEWLMMLDSDVLPHPWIVENLMAHNKDLVGGWYKDKTPVKRKGGKLLHPTVYDSYVIDEDDGFPYYNFFDRPGEGLQEVAGIGAGCILMKKGLAEALGENPYHTNFGVGEDLVMCKKVTDLGYKIFVDWNLYCKHAGVGSV